MKHLNIETNPLLEKLPPHLIQYIKPQIYEDYTPINQAVWRYVMRRNVSYLSKVAHESYMIGLEKTGISIDSIPSMYGMNRILKEIGWAAVAVDGFIPPNGQHPRMLRLLIQRKCSYQTAVVLNHFLNFTKNWDKEITEKVVWPEISLKVTRVKPFINFNATECKLIMKDVFVNG